MADENAARFEQMEQTTQELKEMLLKNQKEHREQMANLMEMVLQLTKGKTTTESPIPIEVATGSKTVQEEPLCPPGSTLIHMQPSQERCPLPFACSYSGGNIRSLTAAMNHDGFFVQAGIDTFSAKHVEFHAP